MAAKQYQHIYCHQLNAYWNKQDNSFVDLKESTKFEGSNVDSSLMEIVKYDEFLNSNPNLTFSIQNIIHIL